MTGSAGWTRFSFAGSKREKSRKSRYPRITALFKLHRLIKPAKQLDAATRSGVYLRNAIRHFNRAKLRRHYSGSTLEQQVSHTLNMEE